MYKLSGCLASRTDRAQLDSPGRRLGKLHVALACVNKVCVRKERAEKGKGGEGETWQQRRDGGRLGPGLSAPPLLCFVGSKT